MKTIYTAVMARLKDQVPELKWIDLDTGQLDVKSDRPAVLFPCALIGIGVRPKRNITDTIQECDAIVTIRLAFDPKTNRSNGEATEEVRAKSLALYDTIADVYAALQGYGTDNFDSLCRTEQGKENSLNGYFQYKIVLKAGYEDNTADK